MLVPIQARTQLMGHTALTAEALDEAVTAFNAVLSQTFQPSGQVIGIPPAGIANLLKLDSTGEAGPMAVVTATVTFGVLVADDQQPVHDLADAFTSSRFPATTFDITTSEQMERLRGLSAFATAHTTASEQAAHLITDIAHRTDT